MIFRKYVGEPNPSPSKRAIETQIDVGIHPMDFSKEPKLYRMIVGSIGGQGGGAISEIMFNAVRFEREIHSGKIGLQGSYEKRSLTPGLAQRSGSVITSLSFLDTHLSENELPKTIVISEMPHATSCDVVIAQEINELIKYIERAKPDAWVLANEDRSVTPLEKLPNYIPTTDRKKQIDAAKKYLEKGTYIGIDGNKIIRDNDLDPRSMNVIMMGMLYAANQLPIAKKAYLQALKLRFKGKIYEANVQAFEIGVEYYKAGRYKERDDEFVWQKLSLSEIKHRSIATAIKHRRKRAKNRLGKRIEEQLVHIINDYPELIAKYLMEGYAQMTDFQDKKHADWFLSLSSQIYKIDESTNHRMTLEFVRNMSGRIMQWDGPFRVAEYAYHDRIDPEAGEIRHMEKKLQPTLEEVVGMIPVPNFIYRHPPGFMKRWYDKRKFKGRSTSIKTTGFLGFSFFWFLSKFKGIRRITVRYRREKLFIEEILYDIHRLQQISPKLSEEACWYIGKIKGYSYIRHNHILAYRKMIKGVLEISNALGPDVAVTFIKNVYSTITNAGQNLELVDQMIDDHKKGQYVIPLTLPE